MYYFFIGYMGSGKSTLGKKVANKLSIPFVDMDKEIEKREGKSINTLFHEKGESYFRDLETAYLTELPSVAEPIIIATGGGTPCFGNNLSIMHQKGVTFYLKRSAKELSQRIQQSKGKRPLVAEKTEEDLLFFIASHLSERLPFYEKATVQLERNQQNVVFLVQYIQDHGINNVSSI